jgi:hypothetical protein
MELDFNGRQVILIYFEMIQSRRNLSMNRCEMWKRSLSRQRRKLGDGGAYIVVGVGRPQQRSRDVEDGRLSWQ